MNKIKFGFCPFCKSTKYDESVSEFVNEYNPYVVMDCYCNDCKKPFTSYYSQDEVKFDKEGEEFIYNNCLSKEEKEIINEWVEEQLRNLNIEEDYFNKLKRINKIMKGELIKE